MKWNSKQLETKQKFYFTWLQLQKKEQLVFKHEEVTKFLSEKK